jgi:hypothetical protein
VYLVETYNLKGMRHNSNSHQLLAVVATVHHQRVGQSLNDRALSLSESLCCISAGRVGDVDGGSDLDVIADIVLATFGCFLCMYCGFVRQ